MNPVRLLATGALLSALSAVPAFAGSASEKKAPGVLEQVARAIVPIDAVLALKIAFQGQTVQEEEVPRQGLGAVVDPSGLLVVGDFAT